MSRKDPLRIAFDLDGVFCDFNKGAAELLNKNFGPIVPDGYDFPVWGWPDQLQPGLEKELWSLVKQTPDFWLNLDGYDQACTDMYQFLNEKHNAEIYYVTSKVPSAGLTVQEQCNMWLGRRGLLTHKTSVIIKHKKRTKAQIYDALQIKYSIDDYDKNTREAFRLDDHWPYLLDQPWNQLFSDLDPLRIKTVSDFLDFIRRQL